MRRAGTSSERCCYNSIMADNTPAEGMELTDYSPDGVDLTLILWMLSLTPAERLEVLEKHFAAILELRRGVQRS